MLILHHIKPTGHKCTILLYHRCISKLPCKTRPILKLVPFSRKKSSLSGSAVYPLYLRAEHFKERNAVIDRHGRYTYGDILHSSHKLADRICDILQTRQDDIQGSRVCFLCPNDISYVVSQWASWISGGIAVPLSTTHPPSELQYFIEDSGSDLIMYSEEYVKKVEPLVSRLGVKSIKLERNDLMSCQQTEINDNERHLRRTSNMLQQLNQNQFESKSALIVYTSGTTGPPKGVVHTYGSLNAQITGMVKAWGWTSSDVILHVLPLHHVHGIVNALMTPLYCGATCLMLPKFDPQSVWNHFVQSDHDGIQVTLFMAVPTIYVKLIEYYNEYFKPHAKDMNENIKAKCTTNLRLMVSGSSALPQPIMQIWKELTGHQLLERYGMTEIGMGLTNPLDGTRIPGAVGNPFPGVKVVIALACSNSDKGYDEIAQGTHIMTTVNKALAEQQGELYVKGPSLFKEYWGRPEATKEAFTEDGWFKTGDTVVYQEGVYKIMGRTSVDIIKSGGYKISALDIERHLLSHPDFKDVAVLGLPDDVWGQKVAAVVVLRGGTNIDLDALRSWAIDRMPPYHVPSVLKVVDDMPRNAMGKVNKKDLVKKLFAEEINK